MSRTGKKAIFSKIRPPVKWHVPPDLKKPVCNRKIHPALHVFNVHTDVMPKGYGTDHQISGVGKVETNRQICDARGQRRFAIRVFSELDGFGSGGLCTGPESVLPEHGQPCGHAVLFQTSAG
jgi:hypothetical protein